MQTNPFSRVWMPLLMAVSALCLMSCAAPQAYQGEVSYKDEAGALCCSLHREKLVAAKGYLQSDQICVLPSPDYVEWRVAFPNCCPLSVSDTKSAYYFQLVHYHYCRACDAELRAKVEQVSKRRALAAKFHL